MQGLCFNKQTLLHRTDLTPLQQRFLLRDVCDVAAELPVDVDLTAGQSLCLMVGQFFHASKMLADDQRRLLLAETAMDVKAYGQALHSELVSDEHRIMDFSIALTDCGHATWTQRKDWLNLETGDYVPALPRRALVTSAVSVSEIARRGIERCSLVKRTYQSEATGRRREHGVERDSD